MWPPGGSRVQTVLKYPVCLTQEGLTLSCLFHRTRCESSYVEVHSGRNHNLQQSKVYFYLNHDTVLCRFQRRFLCIVCVVKGKEVFFFSFFFLLRTENQWKRKGRDSMWSESLGLSASSLSPFSSHYYYSFNILQTSQSY